MASISRDLFKEFAGEGFFDNPKSVNHVVDKLDTRGFSIKSDKKGLVAQLLTKLCQEGVLERQKDEESKYLYVKRKHGNSK